MVQEENVIVCDIDGTLTVESSGSRDYVSVPICVPMRDRLIELKAQGYWIILFTSRSMRTMQGNVGQILKHSAPVLLDWLARHEVPYDELHFGKPWCGRGGFYVDDRAVRPREFLELSLPELELRVAMDRV